LIPFVHCTPAPPGSHCGSAFCHTTATSAHTLSRSRYHHTAVPAHRVYLTPRSAFHTSHRLPGFTFLHVPRSFHTVHTHSSFTFVHLCVLHLCTFGLRCFCVLCTFTHAHSARLRTMVHCVLHLRTHHLPAPPACCPLSIPHLHSSAWMPAVPLTPLHLHRTCTSFHLSRRVAPLFPSARSGSLHYGLHTWFSVAHLLRTSRAHRCRLPHARLPCTARTTACGSYRLVHHLTACTFTHALSLTTRTFRSAPPGCGWVTPHTSSRSRLLPLHTTGSTYCSFCGLPHTVHLHVHHSLRSTTRSHTTGSTVHGSGLPPLSLHYLVCFSPLPLHTHRTLHHTHTTPHTLYHGSSLHTRSSGSLPPVHPLDHTCLPVHHTTFYTCTVCAPAHCTRFLPVQVYTPPPHLQVLVPTWVTTSPFCTFSTTTLVAVPSPLCWFLWLVCTHHLHTGFTVPSRFLLFWFTLWLQHFHLVTSRSTRSTSFLDLHTFHHRFPLHHVTTTHLGLVFYRLQIHTLSLPLVHTFLPTCHCTTSPPLPLTPPGFTALLHLTAWFTCWFAPPVPGSTTHPHVRSPHTPHVRLGPRPLLPAHTLSSLHGCHLFLVHTAPAHCCTGFCLHTTLLLPHCHFLAPPHTTTPLHTALHLHLSHLCWPLLPHIFLPGFLPTLAPGFVPPHSPARTHTHPHLDLVHTALCTGFTHLYCHTPHHTCHVWVPASATPLHVLLHTTSHHHSHTVQFAWFYTFTWVPTWFLVQLRFTSPPRFTTTTTAWLLHTPRFWVLPRFATSPPRAPLYHRTRFTPYLGLDFTPSLSHHHHCHRAPLTHGLHTSPHLHATTCTFTCHACLRTTSCTLVRTQFCPACLPPPALVLVGFCYSHASHLRLPAYPLPLPVPLPWFTWLVPAYLPACQWFYIFCLPTPASVHHRTRTACLVCLPAWTSPTAPSCLQLPACTPAATACPGSATPGFALPASASPGLPGFCLPTWDADHWFCLHVPLPALTWFLQLHSFVHSYPYRFLPPACLGWDSLPACLPALLPYTPACLAPGWFSG